MGTDTGGTWIKRASAYARAIYIVTACESDGGVIRTICGLKTGYGTLSPERVPRYHQQPQQRKSQHNLVEIRHSVPVKCCIPAIELYFLPLLKVTAAMAIGHSEKVP